ncbi:MAG: hypothetical protein KDA91_10260 [Planctomycetaceae bacterium]|nr:hypothetical protein [Planctomycetaceae bacterium]
MARRQHQNSVSLFPFLAVLVCAMGALILLLLVTTRQIREQRLAQGTPSETVPLKLPLVTGEELSSDVDSSARDLELLQDQLRSVTIELADETEKARQLRSEISQVNQELEISRSQGQSLSTEASSLKASLELGSSQDVSREVAEVEQSIAILEQQRSELAEKLSEAEQRILLRRQELVTLNEEVTGTYQEMHERRSAVLSLRRQAASTSSARPKPGETVVEFTNARGTSLNPILVNLSERGMEFLPTEIRLTEDDLRGTSLRNNPFLEGVYALSEFRGKRAGQGVPYVLLLVRPGGASPFYTAQRILTDSGIHFGYELLTDEHQIHAGETDSEEAAFVRDAVLKSLAEQRALLARMQSAGIGNGLDGGGGDIRSGRRSQLTVTPDGRVVTMPDSPEIDGRYFAGGTAPSRPLLSQAARNSRSAPLDMRDRVPDDEPAVDKWSSGREELAQSPPETVPAMSMIESRESDSRFADAELVFQDNLLDQRPNEREQSSLQMFPAGPSASANSSDVEFDVSAPSVQPRGNLEHIDPELLQSLPPGSRSPTTYSTPVGVTVFLDENHLTVGQRPSVVYQQDSMDVAFAHLLKSISEDVEGVRQSAEEPLLPIVKFIVSPGAERSRYWLAKQLRQLGIPSASVTHIEPCVTRLDDFTSTLLASLAENRPDSPLSSAARVRLWPTDSDPFEGAESPIGGDEK